MTTRRLGPLVLVAYVGTIAAANWAVQHYGVVPVGFGLAAPAGVYAAGLAFTLRDLTQDTLGKVAVLGAIAAGALLSAAVSTGRLALASATAFLVSEILDFGIYTPLRKRGWLRAVTLSNLVGLAADSALFLWLAFGSLQFLAGQIVGKAWMTLLAILVLGGVRRAVLARHAPA
jgi:queuosine precursor transporter